MKLPDGTASDFSWERHSLRIALAIDSKLYLANIRPNYKWCYFSQTIVFSYRSKNKAETVVTFWDTKSNEASQLFYREFNKNGIFEALNFVKPLCLFSDLPKIIQVVVINGSL